MKRTIAALAAAAALTAGAHPPHCPQADREGRDACRDLAAHAEHPSESACPDDESAAREACLAEAAKFGRHPVIWRCGDDEDCRFFVQWSRALANEVADLLAAGQCEVGWIGLEGAALLGGLPTQAHVATVTGFVEAMELDCPRIVEVLRASDPDR